MALSYIDPRPGLQWWKVVPIFNSNQNKLALLLLPMKKYEKPSCDILT